MTYSAHRITSIQALLQSVSTSPKSTTTPHDDELELASRADILQAIGTLLSITVALQMLKLLFMPEHISLSAHILNALVHIMLFVASIVLAAHERFYIARLLFIISFMSYLAIACLLWSINLNVQYFFLLGLFVASYLFDKHERLLLSITSLIFCACFIYFQLSLPYSAVAQTWQDGLIASNALVMSIASLLCANSIRQMAIVNWQTLNTHRINYQNVLYKIIPKALCSRLIKQTSGVSSAITKSHPFCSVIFLDFTDFTYFSRHHTETDIVQTLHEVFCEFDILAHKHALHKIKTNGDQYMLAAGIDSLAATPDHIAITNAACQFAIDAQRWFLSRDFTPSMSIRIGIASGPSVAGIIGINKPAYDLWGNTVNTAARLEAYAAHGKILVCPLTRRYAQSIYLFTPFHATHLKGIGLSAYCILLGKK